MNKYFSFFLLVLPALLFAQPSAEKGLEIAILCDEANTGFLGEYSEMEMVLINAHGDSTTRKLVNEAGETADDGDRSISTFLWPADVKGTRMLTWSHKTGDDDQWLYLPALKRVKRISSRNKSGSFMGSEFSYEDLGSQEIEEYTYNFLEEVVYEGRKCWVVERMPVSKGSGYSKEVVWFDQEYFSPLKIEYFDRKAELLKVSVFNDYQQFGKYWRVSNIKVENVQTQKSSVLTWSKRELGKEFKEAHFSSDNLVD